MDAAPQPSSVPAPPAPPRPDVLNAWPPSAQWATAFLLGVSVTLVAVHVFRSVRWGTRPTELQQDRRIGYDVDLNRATYAELVQLPGIGPALAQRIDKHRQEHGPFRRVEELRQVAGIGPAVLDRIRPWVRVTVGEPDEKRGSAGPTTSSSRAIAVTTSNTAPIRGPLSKKEEGLKELIDVNRADVVELQRLPGIGPKLSQRIVEERTKKLFQSVDDLRRVPGIGPKILERLRPYITVGSDPQRVARTG